jgi:anti-sigma B factor antagonist
MFEIKRDANGTITLHGRLDASQVENARTVFDHINESCKVDFAELSYVSSAGLGLLFGTQKRLVEGGGGLTLINLSPHIREIFQIAGFDNIFEIVD